MTTNSGAPQAMRGSDPVSVVVFGAAGEPELPGISRFDASARFRFATDESGLANNIGDAEVFLGWDFRAGALERVWSRARRLRWVHWAGAGVDAALFPALADSDVILTNARGIFDRAMAEYVLAMVLGLAKGLPRTTLSQVQRRWDFRLTETIQDQTALLVGVGSIGSEIGALLKASGMRTIGVGRRGRSGHPVFGDVHAIGDLETLVASADYVINATPSTPRTRGRFGPALFAAMNASARFINVGRGDAVDEAALVDALQHGRIAGAALDVFADEPLPESSALWTLDNVIVSPHMSGDILDSHERLVAQFLDNLGRFVRDEPLHNVVDKHQGY